MMMFQPFQSITLRFELLLEAQIMSWSTIKLPLTVNEKSHDFNPYWQISGHEQDSITGKLINQKFMRTLSVFFQNRVMSETVLPKKSSKR